MVFTCHSCAKYFALCVIHGYVLMGICLFFYGFLIFYSGEFWSTAGRILDCGLHTTGSHSRELRLDLFISASPYVPYPVYPTRLLESKFQVSTSFDIIFNQNIIFFFKFNFKWVYLNLIIFSSNLLIFLSCHYGKKPLWLFSHLSWVLNIVYEFMAYLK